MAQNPPYIPAADALAGPWSDNFSTLLTAAPTDYGLVAGDAVAVAAVVTPWLAALVLATNPATRTPVTVADKDTARAAMEAVVRPYAVQISQNPLISNGLKTGIGVTPRILTKTRNSVVAEEAVLAITYTALSAPILTVTNPATPLTKARPLGAISWEYQLQSRLSDSGPWVNEPGGFGSKPQITLNPADFDPDPFYRIRVRWVGAALTGGAQNVGPWYSWTEFVFPAP